MKRGNYFEFESIRYIDSDSIVLFILLLNELLVYRLQYAPVAVATLCVTVCVLSVVCYVCIVFVHACDAVLINRNIVFSDKVFI